MAVSIIGASGFVADAQEPASTSSLSPWDRVFDLRAGAGYNDNVTLSHAAPEQAPFLYTSLEALVSRLPVDGNEFTFTLTAEDARFLGPGDVDNETVVLARAEGKKSLPSGWQPGLALEYFFQDRVLDVSTTETNQQAELVRGHTATARPGVRLDLTPRWWLALETPANYQFFAESLDDYWEAGARATVGLSYGNRSEVALSYGATHRAYESDPALDADGAPITGEDKAFWQQESRLAWRHYWDGDRRWRTTARLGFKANRDSASGYYDFNRYSVDGRLRYRAGPWEFSAEAGVYYYRYAVQTVSGPGSSPRERTELTAGLRCERQIAKAWRAFAAYEYERILANVAIEEYSVNKVTAGVSWEF